MKNRLSKAMNFLAFNLLFFALYLNFVQKPKTGYEYENIPVSTVHYQHTETKPALNLQNKVMVSTPVSLLQ